MESIEAPSKELEQFEINPIDTANQKKWAELFVKIPCCRIVITSLRQFDEGKENEMKDVIFDEGIDETVFLIGISLEPGMLSDYDEVDCNFEKINGKYIASVGKLPRQAAQAGKYRKKYPDLIKKKFFGFTGTWEEVTKKLIEANNILTTVPAFQL